MRQAFGMGHAYKPLALTALSALERWLAELPAPLRPHMPRLLPCLGVYLTVSADEGERQSGDVQD